MGQAKRYPFTAADKVYVSFDVLLAEVFLSAGKVLLND